MVIKFYSLPPDYWDEKSTDYNLTKSSFMLDVMVIIADFHLVNGF